MLLTQEHLDSLLKQEEYFNEIADFALAKYTSGADKLSEHVLAVAIPKASALLKSAGLDVEMNRVELEIEFLTAYLSK
jgi:hypothetical protein